MILGLPDEVSVFPGFDRIGARTRMANDVSIFRFGGPGPDALTIGDDCVIYTGVRFVLGDITQHPETGVRIGHRVHVNAGSYLSGEGGLSIADDVLIGPHAKILSAGHEIDGGHPRISEAPLSYAPIAIGCGAWIGAGAFVLQGVEIGEGAVVAAGAVVTRPVPAFSICAGVPARVLRYRKGFAPATATALPGQCDGAGWSLRRLFGRSRR